MGRRKVVAQENTEQEPQIETPIVVEPEIIEPQTEKPIKEPEISPDATPPPDEVEVLENLMAVTIPPYSSAYKKLAAEQWRSGVVTERGHIVIGDKEFKPGEVYGIAPQDAEEPLRKGLLLSVRHNVYRKRPK